MVELEFKAKTQELIDSLKSICANYGLGNDGNEFKIITQIFLYKFLNDKFAYEAKKIDEDIANADNWEKSLSDMSAEEYEMVTATSEFKIKWFFFGKDHAKESD